MILTRFYRLSGVLPIWCTAYQVQRFPELTEQKIMEIARIL